MTTVSDLEGVGYVVGVAYGSAEVERDALDRARATAGEDVVVAQAQQVTRESLGQLAAAGQLPPEADRQALAERIAARALEAIQTHVDERVAFHERALAAAEAMPTVWHVAGHGVAVYVAVGDDGRGADKDARRLLDRLAAHAADS